MLKHLTGEKNMNKAACRNNLYRIPARGKIFGVCAGIAAYFGWQPWKVRLITVIAALFTGLWLVVVGYLVAFFILEPEPRPEQRKQPVNQPRT
jgi:phage shock protein C